MRTETLHFESARLAQQLYNNDPRNLTCMEQQLSVKATSREGWIKLEGAPEAVECAKQLFQQLEGAVKSGGTVRNRDFAYALEVVQHEGVAALKSLHAERVQTSTRKAMIVPKTMRMMQAGYRRDPRAVAFQRLQTFREGVILPCLQDLVVERVHAVGQIDEGSPARLRGGTCGLRTQRSHAVEHRQSDGHAESAEEMTA